MDIQCLSNSKICLFSGTLQINGDLAAAGQGRQSNHSKIFKRNIAPTTKSLVFILIFFGGATTVRLVQLLLFLVTLHSREPIKTLLYDRTRSTKCVENKFVLKFMN